MAEQVEYELSLKDMLTGKVEGANTAVNKLEGSMHSLGERVLHVGEAFGISFALFKGIEFIHEGIEAFEKLHQAESQLENTMQNMGKYTEESFEKSVKGAGDLASHIKYTQSEIIELQSQLGLVGSIGEDEMGRLIKVSADLSTKMGIGLNEAGNLLAKAINAPEMARRLGMALKIDPAIMNHVQQLAKSGHEAAARMELLAIAESKVGGAAQAAFDADPLARFNKLMNSIKLEMGGLATSLLRSIVPAIEWIAQKFKEIAGFIKEHKDGIIEFIELVAEFAAPLVVITALTYAWNVALGFLATALEGVAFVMDLILANPIAAAIGVVTVAVIYAYKHFAVFRGVIFAVWEVLKEFGTTVSEIFKGLYTTLQGVFHFNLTEIKSGLGEIVSAVETNAFRIGMAAKKGYEEGIADFNKSQAELAAPKDNTKKNKPQNQFGTLIKDETKGAKGTKNINITVNIGNLIKDFSISTQNIIESAAKVKEMVAEALISATNDSQIIAGE